MFVQVSRLHSLDVAISKLKWSDVVRSVIQANAGTALSSADTDGWLRANPRPDEVVHAKALLSW